MLTTKLEARKSIIITGILIFIYCIALIVLTQYRHIDGDEGYYASAIRLVSEGDVVYHDFIYPQAPLLP